MRTFKIDSSLTEEQDLFRKSVRGFVEKEVAPVAAELDERGGPELDRAAFKKWMDDGDLVRYAKVDADPPTARAALKTAREFVVATKPPVPREPA